MGWIGTTIACRMSLCILAATLSWASGLSCHGSGLAEVDLRMVAIHIARPAFWISCGRIRTKWELSPLSEFATIAAAQIHHCARITESGDNVLSSVSGVQHPGLGF